jgi:hypothetical protein
VRIKKKVGKKIALLNGNPSIDHEQTQGLCHQATHKAISSSLHETPSGGSGGLLCKRKECLNQTPGEED